VRRETAGGGRENQNTAASNTSPSGNAAYSPSGNATHSPNGNARRGVCDPTTRRATSNRATRRRSTSLATNAAHSPGDRSNTWRLRRASATRAGGTNTRKRSKHLRPRRTPQPRIQHNPQGLPPLEPRQPHIQQRIIRQHSPDTRHHRRTARPPALDIGAGGFAGDPLARAVGEGRAAVEAHGEFDAHPGEALFHALHEANIELSGFVLHEPRFNGDTGAQKRIGALPAHARIGVLDSKHDTRDARFDQGIGAGRCAAVVTARLERNVRRRASNGLLGGAQRHDFSMGLAGALVPAFANDAITLGEYTSNPRVGMSCFQASLSEG
jgi:hypothetical protein